MSILFSAQGLINVTRKGQFGVALNEGHFRDILFELVPPPAQQPVTRAGKGVANPAADLMMMGFPMRLPLASPPSLCACHSELKSEGFLCPRCLAKVCDVPTDCDICGLMIVSSPHLARSYHHLFPVKPYKAVYVFLHVLLSSLSADDLLCATVWPLTRSRIRALAVTVVLWSFQRHPVRQETHPLLQRG